MKNNLLFKKEIITVTGVWISNKMGMLLPALSLLVMLMAVDYISGMLASKKEALEHLGDVKYGWSSKKSIIGIYKKVGYILTVLVAVTADYLIFKFSKEIGINVETNTIFGLLVSIWFILNELISILENAGRMGVALPKLLVNILSELQKNIDNNENSKN